MCSYTINSERINPVFDPTEDGLTTISQREINGATYNKERINPGFDSIGDDLTTTSRKEINGVPIENRAQWGNQIEFLMTCISMSVGLGNLWRFPVVAYRNGGGAFLIPYLIVLLLIGRPIYYLEMFLGQFCGRANVKLFGKLAPACSGIAFAQIFASINAAFYYSSIIAVTIYYFVESFSKVLPWSVCQEEWVDCGNSKNSTKNSTSSAELYYRKSVLNEKADIDDGIGVPELRLTLALFFAWLTVFLVTIKGIRSTGKASYLLAILPYVIMIVLLIKGITLEGSYKGILYFITPKWEKMFEVGVWYEAVTQCFFSLNLASGAIIMYSSYNDLHHNIKRDSIIISLTDTVSSLLAGFTIFAVLGNLAHILNTDIDSVLKSGGPGIAFVSYPTVLANIEFLPQIFSVLFFVMLFILGIGSLVSMPACIITVLQDQFPKLKDWWVVTGTCVIGFLIGLVYVTPGGQFVLNLVDFYVVTYILFIMAIAELILAVWIYGLENICLDLEFISHRKVNVYWRLCWGVVTPLLLLFILINSFIHMKKLTYGPVQYTDTALGVGWFLFAFAIFQIPLWMIWTLFRKRILGFSQAIISSFSSKKWCPKNINEHRSWRSFKKEKIRERRIRCPSRLKYILKTLLGLH